ncbi:MAG: bifunctional nuclease family protein [Deltaproteobacteria bacterium]|nr:bifunctional nuclease family protein [Deltaproteobacteria bacterium]
MLIEMKVFGLAIDPVTNTPIVILKDLQGKRALPIWIGLFEASAIATQLEKINFTRPMTHDLMNEILKVMNATITKIVINDLKNNTFFATIYLLKDDATIAVDARPSDALALCLRAGAPILVEENVIEKSSSIDFSKRVSDLKEYSEEELKDFLENLSPDDFGKYKM